MSAGLNNLKHIVVLMMENRSFDHMLGALKSEDPRINGLTGTESNLDTTNEPAKVLPQAKFMSQLDPDPDHHFPAVHKQLYFGTPGPPGTPSMGGFVQSYWEKRQDVKHSRQIMDYFATDKLVVLHALARNYAVFNGWFSSIPGPTLFNRAFAHYGTSVGLTLRAGGFPLVSLLFSFGGHEGSHTSTRVNGSLLGGSARPSLY
jgi:phospholipase C